MTVIKCNTGNHGRRGTNSVRTDLVQSACIPVITGRSIIRKYTPTCWVTRVICARVIVIADERCPGGALPVRALFDPVTGIPVVTIRVCITGRITCPFNGLNKEGFGVNIGAVEQHFIVIKCPICKVDWSQVDGSSRPNRPSFTSGKTASRHKDGRAWFSPPSIVDVCRTIKA